MPRPSFRSKLKNLFPGDKSNEKTSPRGSIRSQSKSPAPLYTSQPPNDDHGNRAEAPLQDLWHAAYQQLSPVDQITLKALQTQDQKQLTAVLDNIIIQTKEKYEVRKPIREKAIGIVGAVLKFKEVVDQVSCFDPTKHAAAAAWGLVSIALGMVKNDGEISTATLEACLYLTDVLARYAIIEQRYRAGDDQCSPSFKNAIIRGYKAVLEYCAAVKVVKDSGTARRALTSLTPLTDHNLTSLKSRLAENDSILGQWLRLVEYEGAQTKRAHQLLGTVDNIAAKVNAAEHAQILNWLSSETASTTHTDAVESRCAGTGQWLLDHYDYKNWRDISSGSRFLWVYGGAGLGKTVLCSTAIQNIQALSEQDHQTKLAYWYFRFNNTSQDIISRMLRSFIRQLSAASISTPVAALYKFHQGPNTHPTLDELMSVLDEILSHLDCKVFLIIDGLDECPESGQNQNRRVVLNYVKRILEKRYVSLRIFITSRQEPDIESGLDDILNSPVGTGIAADYLVGPDIDMYVESKITEKFHRFSEDIQTSIRDTLTNPREKRFRWVQLQVDTLEKEGTRRNVHIILKSLPKSLEESYQRILDQRPESLREDIRRILMYLAVAYRPLTIDEIASAVDLDPEDIRKHCTSTLVTLTKDRLSGTSIKLAHFSVKEYLLIKAPPPKLWCQFTEAAAHIEISSASLSCLLNFKAKPITEEDCHKMRFIVYGAKYWPRHAMEGMSKSPDDSGVVATQVRKIFSPECSQSYLSWLRLSDWRDSWRPPNFKWTMDQVPPPLYLAALHGFSDTFRELIQNGAEIIPRVEKAKYNALIPAVINCHTEIVSEILKTVKTPTTYDVSKIFSKIGAENKTVFSTVIHTILSAAFPASSPPIAVTEDIVVAAARNSRYHDTTIIDYLLDRERYQIEISENVLVAAAQHHNADIMRVLLDQRGDEFQITHDVMAAAATSQSSSVMSLLLERRADEIQITEDVLKNAAGLDKNETILLLIDHLGDDFHITADIVLEAAKENSSNNIKILLDRYQIAITHDVVLAAAESHGSEVMSLLLDQRRDDIHITEDILVAAAGNSICREGGILKLLLDRLDLQEHTIKITHDVVMAAASNYYHDPMKLLLDRQADRIQITEDVLLAAASPRSSATFKLLLDRQADKIQITNEVVKKAASSSQKLGLLLDLYGDQIKITHDVVKNAAGSYKDRSALELLFDRRRDELKITQEIVQAAARTFNMEAINLLLDRREADVKITQEVLIGVSKRSDDSKTMERLLDKLGDDFSIPQEVVISAASNHMTDEVLRLLLYRRRDEIQITHDVVVATARWAKARTMQLLLDQRGNEIQITQEVLVEAAKNPFTGTKIMKLLLHQRGSEVHVTSDVLVAATESYEIMKLLMSRRPDEIDITPDVMIASARSSEVPKVMKLLLDLQGDQFQAFQEMAVEAAANYGADLSFKFLLLNRGEHVQITQDLLVAAASNPHSYCMELLLKHRGDEVRITPDVVMAATQSYLTMKLLLDVRSDKIQITEDLLIKTTRSSSGRDVFKLLLDRRGDEVHITPDVLEAAARYRSHKGSSIMNLLMNERADDVQITHEVLMAALRHSDSLSMLMALLDRQGGEIQVTQDVLVAAVEKESIDFVMQLLQRQGDDIHITEAVLTAAMDNTGSEDMIGWILENGVHYQLTEKLLVVVVASYDSSTLSSGWKTFLHKYGKTAPLTWDGLHESLVGAKALSALSCCVDYGGYLDMTEETSSLLVNHTSRELVNRVLGCDEKSTFELPSPLEQAVSDGLSIEAIKMRSLFTNDEMTEEIFKAAAETLSDTFTALNHSCQGEQQPYVTLLNRAARSLRENLMECLSKLVGDIQITHETLKVAAECLNAVTIKFLLEHASTVQITEGILKAAARNRHDALAVIKTLLGHDESLRINEDILLAALSNRGGGAKHFVKSLFRLYKSYGGHLPLTGAMLQAASKLPYPEPIDAILFQPLAGFDFTNEILEAIARSASEGIFQEALLHASDDQITASLIQAALRNHNWEGGLPDFFERRIKAKKSLVTEDLLIFAYENNEWEIAENNMMGLFELRKDLLIPRRLLEKLIPAADRPIKRDTLAFLLNLVGERGDAEVVEIINELLAGRKVDDVFLRSEMRLASAKTRQHTQA